jgi:hypothetical protein
MYWTLQNLKKSERSSKYRNILQYLEALRYLMATTWHHTDNGVLFFRALHSKQTSGRQWHSVLEGFSCRVNLGRGSPFGCFASQWH